MKDLYEWSANRPEWDELRKELANRKLRFDVRSNGSFESFLRELPDSDRRKWQDLFSAYLADHLAETGQPSTILTKGQTDPAGRTVRRIHVDTDEFVIYCADDAADPDDSSGLHYLFKPGVSNEAAKGMRAGFCSIAAQIARLADTVSAMRSWRESRRQRQERERAFELMARAMQFAFEGEPKQAEAVLAELRDEINLRRDSRNRMRYIFATTVSFLAILFAGVLLKDTNTSLFGEGLGTPANKNLLINVLLFGAMGAFFAVVYDIKAVKVHHAITIPEMIYAGAVRIPVGVIAAAVVVLLFTGGWMLGGIGESSRDWSLLLLAFLAGFSEMFVPNALKEVEARSSVTTPGERTGEA